MLYVLFSADLKDVTSTQRAMFNLALSEQRYFKLINVDTVWSYEVLEAIQANDNDIEHAIRSSMKVIMNNVGMTKMSYVIQLGNSKPKGITLTQAYDGKFSTDAYDPTKKPTA